jgi:dihydrofolate reductase
MGKLTFGMMISLDGYINDRNGHFDWGYVSEEVHRSTEKQQENEGTTIYGRRMYETMAVWDSLDKDPNLPQYERDFSVAWQKTDKIVVSRSLKEAPTKRTQLVSELTADDIGKLKAASDKDVGISGPTLAATYLKQGLIDEISIYYVPVVVGGGTAMFQGVTDTLKLDRLEERAFANGVTFVRYHVPR